MTVMTRPREFSAAERLPDNGGRPGRRAMTRWAWRLFRREWRQQLLVLALIVVAVAATVIGAAAATNSPPPKNAGFGTAQDLVTLGPSPALAHQIAAVEHRVGRVDVIENQSLIIPGTIEAYDLRSQNPHGAFGQPMLALVSGRYPTTTSQVAVTAGVAAAFRLHFGGTFSEGGTSRRVVGIVENPQSLLDAFALVIPGQVHAPTQVTVLFDKPPGVRLGPNVVTPSSVSNNNPLNPETIVMALATLGMLLIALVAVGGFTVLAQRRLRSIGMLGSLGATDRNIRLVVRMNGVVVGVVGTLLGAVLGVLAWLAYRPHVEASSHHLIGLWALPWAVIGPSMGLAVLATYFAASRPARAMAKVPIVTALSGRPPSPKPAHRSIVPGVLAIVAAILLLGVSGASSHGGGMPELIFGLVALIVAVILLAPLCVSALARVSSRAPIGLRLALRDLARYRSRSSTALAAVALGVLIAVIVAVAAAARYGNVLDYAGPNLASDQLIVYTPNGSGGPLGVATTDDVARSARTIATELGAREFFQLDSTSANLQHAGPGRNFNGQLYVATPQLLQAFGIAPSTIEASTEVLTVRPGLAGMSDMQLVYGDAFGSKGLAPGRPGPNPFACPKSSCLDNPAMQQVSALPAGTSAPNTVLTEHAVRSLHLQLSNAGWMIETTGPLSATQIHDAQQTAALAGMSVETKNDAPNSSEIINWATVFGVVLALAILAMTVGLIRSETASDLRTLTATGASSRTRRVLTGSTAGALAFLGAVIGTAGGYLATAAWLRNSSLNGGLSALGNVPSTNLLIILVGMPLVAAAAGWLLAGREPPAIARQPIE